MLHPHYTEKKRLIYSALTCKVICMPAVHRCRDSRELYPDLLFVSIKQVPWQPRFTKTIHGPALMALNQSRLLSLTKTILQDMTSQQTRMWLAATRCGFLVVLFVFMATIQSAESFASSPLNHKHLIISGGIDVSRCNTFNNYKIAINQHAIVI